MEMPWMPISTAPEGKLVFTAIIDDTGERMTQSLRRSGSLWFVSDGGMYVYYAPTHWKEIA